MKKRGKKKAKFHPKSTGKKYFSWNEINKALEELRTPLEKIDYLKKVLAMPDLLREKVKEKAYKLLGEKDIELGDIKDAGIAFKKSGDKRMALECYRTAHTFTEKHEKELEEYEEKLKKLNF
jgi:hypothetical protein